MEKVYKIIEGNGLKEKIGQEEMKELMIELCQIFKKQNIIISEYKNDYIRLKNRMNILEEELDECNIYKNLCNIILNRVNSNPISSLWFLYKLKKKIKKFN